MIENMYKKDMHKKQLSHNYNVERSLTRCNYAIIILYVILSWSGRRTFSQKQTDRFDRKIAQ